MGAKQSDSVNMLVIVQVKPSSKKGPLIEKKTDGGLVVYVNAPAIDGKANSQVQKLLADHFGVSKSCVKLIGGMTSRFKRFDITV